MTVQNPNLTRRTILAGATIAPLGLLAACNAITSPLTDPDDVVKAATAASERDLIAAYNATIGAFGQLAAALTPLRDQHREHLSAVGGVADERAAEFTAVSAKAALAALTAAELAASNQRVDQCGQANARELIWTLSLIGASEAQHVLALAGAKA